jgi:hypothetical protein
MQALQTLPRPRIGKPVVVILLVIFAYFAWPWLRPLPKKLGPITSYRVFEAADHFDGEVEPTTGGWRQPTSRWELFATPDHLVMYEKKQINSLYRRRNVRSRIPQLPPPIPQAPGDKLDDFVIDHGDWYGPPQSPEALDEAITLDKDFRATEFFGRNYGSKPFYGRLPTWLCNRGVGAGGGHFRPSSLQIRKDFKYVDVSLETPKQPEVFIVAAAGIYNAKQAAYYRTPPVAYSSEDYWAVVYAGSSHSSPRAIFLDRVTISPTSTEIRLLKPRPTGGTRDVHPYWFFIPLGRLPDGNYTVNVKRVNDNSLIATTTANLRQATKEELEDRNAGNETLQRAATKYFEDARQAELEYGAALQLRLERLAEFVYSAQLSDADRELLANDVKRLGEAADWNQDIYDSYRYRKYALAPPTPGTPLDIDTKLRPWEANHPDWKPAVVNLSDIWLCDATDADWYASATYRNIPEFNGALTANEPSAIQKRIRDICTAIQNRGGPKHGENLFCHLAAGTIEDAINTAYEVQVENKPVPHHFSKEDDLWAVFAARRSFLIQQVDSSSIFDNSRKLNRRQFRVCVSAYIGDVDTNDVEKSSPVTFALIPLGKLADVEFATVFYTCNSIASRQVNADKPTLLETDLPNPIYNNFSTYLGDSSGAHLDLTSSASQNARSQHTRLTQ